MLSLTKRVLSGVALAGLVAVTAPSFAEAQERFVLGLASPILTFHPWDQNGSDVQHHPQFYNRLVYYDKELNPVSDLAESWEFSDDGTVLTLNLREGIMFQTGKEFTSEDIRRSWLQITEGEFHGSHANLKPLAQLVSEIRTPDPYTAEIVYEQPNPAVFDFLDLFYVVDMDAWDQHNDMPIGTGPYKLKEYLPGNRIVMEVFEGYWGPIPEVEEIEFRIIPDPKARTLNLQSGEVDAIMFFPTRDVNLLRDAGFEVWATNPNGLIFDLLFGVNKPPLDDKRVRQAIALMINRDRFHRIVMGGLGEPRCMPWSENQIAYDPELATSCEFNPEKAKALLEEAGFGDGFEVEIITSTQQSPERAKFAELLQNDLRQIGIDVKIRDMDAAGATSVYRAKDYALYTHTFGRANKDPASLFGTATVWKPVGNTQNYDNPEYERLTKEAASTLDLEKRKELYAQINQIVVDDVFIVAYHTNPRWIAHSTEWEGIDASVDGDVYLFGVKPAS
ncbi:MAG: ABC transporter substrate-binding protein [Pseudomonadota bacterium]